MKSSITKPTCRERLFYLNKIAEKEAEKAAVIVEKDGVIAYYRRAAELAMRSKHRALNRQDEQRKDLIAYGVLAVCAALALWLAGAAVHEFI